MGVWLHFMAVFFSVAVVCQEFLRMLSFLSWCFPALNSQFVSACIFCLLVNRPEISFSLFWVDSQGIHMNGIQVLPFFLLLKICCLVPKPLIKWIFLQYTMISQRRRDVLVGAWLDPMTSVTWWQVAAAAFGPGLLPWSCFFVSCLYLAGWLSPKPPSGLVAGRQIEQPWLIKPERSPKSPLFHSKFFSTFLF